MGRFFFNTGCEVIVPLCISNRLAKRDELFWASRVLEDKVLFIFLLLTMLSDLEHFQRMDGHETLLVE